MRAFWRLETRFSRWRAENKTTYLLVSLLGVQLVYPYVVELKAGFTLVSVAVTLILVTAALAVSDERWHTRVGVSLVVPALAVRWLQVVSGRAVLPVLTNLIETAFLVFTTWIVLGYVLRTGRITRDKLFGAATVYLLVATIFADLFQAMEQIHPGSFTVADDLDLLSQRMEFGYFSLVTLTTLGYGDITPVTAKARSLVTLEAFTGVMYMATLVARLVSMYSTHAANDEDE